MALLRPRDWSLRARLTALIVVLLAASSVVIGGVMFVFVANALTAQFNTELASAGQRATGPGSQSGQDAGTQDAGTILAYYGVSTAATGGTYTKSASSGSASNLTSAQLASIKSQLSGLDEADNTLDVNVTHYGAYRFRYVGDFVLRTSGEEVHVFLGRPLSSVRQQIAFVLFAIIIVVLAAIVLAAVIGALIVGRALRPLKRVAGIATDVSQMQLDRGDVDLAERVPAEDTNRNTEVGQVGAALNSLLDSVGTALAVRQASEAKVRHFVADASHELRTPLASIRGYAELTRRFGGDLGDTVSHNIDRIESESVRMTSLVEDLLLLARLDSQRELDELEVDLSRMLVDVVSDAHAAGRDHVWDVEIPEEPVLLVGDEARLQQVFTNLLANARVHTPAGTHVAVELHEPRDGEVVVVVRDSGPGIPPELLPTMFERFVRGDSSRNRGTGSTGLGLSIVSAVTQAHHGSVTVESEPGRTEFTVRLPAAPVQPA